MIILVFNESGISFNDRRNDRRKHGIRQTKCIVKNEKEFLLRGRSEALSDLFNICNNVHRAGSAASSKAYLDLSCVYKAKAGSSVSHGRKKAVRGTV